LARLIAGTLEEENLDAIQLFAKQFVSTRYDDLPKTVVEVTKKEVLDFFAVALAGQGLPAVKELVELVVEWGGKSESSLIHMKQKVPAPVAAQANAVMGHALDFDDVHDLAVMHPAAPVVPTCMAVAESLGQVSGREFITAAALGVDMICRLALASWPGYDPARPETRDLPFQAERAKNGWHFTTIMGFLASAGAAGKLLALNDDRLVSAFGIAYHQCSGNHQGRDDGTYTKRLGPGFSARAGVASAMMAGKGITGPRNSLEGHMGLYRMYFQDGYDRETLIADLGSRYEGVNVSIKPYPCCRGIHPNIDATLSVVSQHAIKPEDVKEVRVFVDEGGYQMLCSPLAVKTKPRTPVDAQFSIPWGVATALAKGQVGIEHFTESAITSLEILHMASKITVVLDHSLDSSDKVPSGKVEVVTKSGKVYSNRIDYPLGSPERPMTFDDCARKFKSCASYPADGLSDGQIERTIDLIGRLEQLDDVGEVMRSLAP
jgi:2-methylcitrate dehydratase PrpD